VKEVLTVSEAAEYLGVSRTKMWQLIKEGSLSSTQNPLDKRQRLISSCALEQLRSRGNQPPRPYPRTIGMIADPDFHAREAEEYMQTHRPHESC
jgi:excisionase family DNA binding protein